MAFDKAQQRTLDQLEAALEAHGYFISAELIPGLEEEFLADVRSAWNKVEDTAAYLRRFFRYRGLSRNLLRELHIRIPSPSFNVSSALIAEINNRER